MLNKVNKTFIYVKKNRDNSKINKIIGKRSIKTDTTEIKILETTLNIYVANKLDNLEK